MERFKLLKTAKGGPAQPVRDGALRARCDELIRREGEAEGSRLSRLLLSKSLPDALFGRTASPARVLAMALALIFIFWASMPLLSKLLHWMFRMPGK